MDKEIWAEEYEVFSYEGADLSFAVYMVRRDSILGHSTLECAAVVDIASEGDPVIVSNQVRIDGISTADEEVAKNYIWGQIMEGLNLLFKQIIFNALPNKYVPKRLALEPWGG